MVVSQHEHRATSDLRSAQVRALWIALAVNAGYMVVEVIGGLLFGSLALLADAAHMLSDVAGLSIAVIAQSLLTRPASARHTFGMQRAEVIGAQVNGLVLVASAVWILFEAVDRVSDPPDVAGGGVVAVAAVGLAVNVFSAAVLRRSMGRSLNLRGALMHMVLDAVASVGVIAAGVAVVMWDARLADPVASVAIALLVLWSAWRLLRDTTHVLMEGTPKGLDLGEVERLLAESEGVRSVHHLHLWNLASDVPALSAHVVLSDDVSLHEAQDRGDRLKDMLRVRFGIEHATLELECHPCAPAQPSHSLGR